MTRRAQAGAATAVVVVCVGAVLASAGSGGTSHCGGPNGAPVTLSGPDRRSPAVASDGAGTIEALWESNTGGPIERSSRSAGTWSVPTAVSGPAGRAPVIALTATGGGAAAWERSTDRATTTIEVTLRDTAGIWGPVTALTASGAKAHEPQVGITGDGTTVVVWRRDTAGARATVIEVAERPAGGGWTPPTMLSDPARRSTHPRLAVAVNGTAVVTWQQSDAVVMAAGRRADGAWAAPVRVSDPGSGGRLAEVAIGPTGSATAVWLGGTGGSVFAATQPDDAQWSPPTLLDDATTGPRPAPGIGRTAIGPDVTVLADGRSAATWLRADGRTNRVMYGARDADGTWSPARALSAPQTQAGGVQIVGVAGGSALVGWDELDAGLVRGRLARIDGATAGQTCTDVTAARTETGALQLVGGATPLAVFVELNRSRIQATAAR